MFKHYLLISLLFPLSGFLSAQHVPQGAAPVPAASGPALEAWLKQDAPFWSWTSESFARETREAGFRSLGAAGEGARAAPPKGTFWGQPAFEVVVRFADDVPDTVNVSFFNRGDSDQNPTEAEFQDQVRRLMATLTAALGVQPTPGTGNSRIAMVRDDRWVWQLTELRYELAFSFTPQRRDGPFRAEFIQLQVKKFKPGDMPASASTRINPYAVREKIKRDAVSGDVWLEGVPMVDQGPKGYCAAATAERIMRFFGQDVDQHQVAQIANTTSAGGTNFEALRNALQAVGRQYGFTVNTHLAWDFKDFKKEIDRYNKNAKRAGKAEIELQTTGVIQIGDVYAKMDAATFQQSKLEDKAGLGRFQERIQKAINGGCPLAWGVTLGFFPETPAYSGTGGHLRMIIGYNATKREIIFSDSWGKGHELKRMPIEQAFTISTSLFTLEPKGLRL